jgi:hypothetical protein
MQHLKCQHPIKHPGCLRPLTLANAAAFALMSDSASAAALAKADADALALALALATAFTCRDKSAEQQRTGRKQQDSSAQQHQQGCEQNGQADPMRHKPALPALPLCTTQVLVGPSCSRRSKAQHSTGSAQDVPLAGKLAPPFQQN